MIPSRLIKQSGRQHPYSIIGTTGEGTVIKHLCTVPWYATSGKWILRTNICVCHPVGRESHDRDDRLLVQVRLEEPYLGIGSSTSMYVRAALTLLLISPEVLEEFRECVCATPPVPPAPPVTPVAGPETYNIFIYTMSFSMTSLVFITGSKNISL